ncbi:MAG: PEP-CTERM sorting domain-containing protein [Candidatus Brocadiaceae bacterium]
MKRKFIGFLVLSALAVGLAAPPARAVTIFPPGEFTASVTDRSNLFSNQDNDEYLEPEGSGSEINVGDEQRSIIKVDAINTGDKKVDGSTGTKFVQEDGGSIAYDNGLLTGMLYDLEISRIIDQTTGLPAGPIIPPASGTTVPYTLEKDTAGRYLSAAGGGTDGQWTDTIGPAVSDTVNGVDYGGILVIYEDPAFNLSFAGDSDGVTVGAGDWREPGDVSGVSPHPGAATMKVPGVLTDADYFPTISDVAGTGPGNDPNNPDDSGTAEPWLVAVLVDLHDIPAHGAYGANPFQVGDRTFLKEYDLTVDSTGQVKFDGLAFANVIGGTAAHMFDLGNFSIFSDDGTIQWLADVRIEFEGWGNFVQLFDGWQIDSDDPTMFGVIPEPATMSLLGLALVGLAAGGYRRKRKS